MGDNTSKLYKLNKTSTTAPEYFSNHSGGLPIPVSLFIFALHRRRISFHFCQEPRWNFFARPCRPARDFPKKSDISELCAKKLYFCKRMYSARLLSQCYRAFNCLCAFIYNCGDIMNRKYKYLSRICIQFWPTRPLLFAQKI